MSKPLVNVGISTLPFSDRLQLVQEAIEQRISQTPTTNPAHIRARLWVQWLKKNVLDVPAGREVAV